MQLNCLEPKLTAAQRIVPEWKDYDAEIKNLLNRVQDQEHDDAIDAASTESSQQKIPTKSKSIPDGSDDGSKHTEL